MKTTQKQLGPALIPSILGVLKKHLGYEKYLGFRVHEVFGWYC